MASTIQLQRTVTLASAFNYYAPLTMSANDPALSNADWVRQFILSAPLAWRWNRGTVSIPATTIGVSDYTLSVPQFGWIEKAVLLYTVNGNQTQELEVENVLAVESVANQPTKISAQVDDDAGNITFRLTPTPDAVYQIDITYQQAAPTFVALTDTWSPIPDYFSYLYNQGFLAKTLEYRNDPRFAGAMQLFMQMVAAANEGLSDAQKNIFLLDRLNTQRQSQNVAAGRA